MPIYLERRDFHAQIRRRRKDFADRVGGAAQNPLACSG